jgi:hypothetical protein
MNRTKVRGGLLNPGIGLLAAFALAFMLSACPTGGGSDVTGNANLASLGAMGNRTLAPLFDPAITSYTVTVPNDEGEVIVGITATPDDPSSSITWKPAQSVIVAAGGQGVVTAKVTASGGAEKPYTVTVIHAAVAVTGITLNYTSYPLTVSGTVPLVATILPAEVTTKTVTWTSSAPATATVDDNGLVTAKASGTATITATSKADSTKTATCVITVLKAGDTGLAIGFGGFTESDVDLTKSALNDLSKSGGGSITVSVPNTVTLVEWRVDGEGVFGTDNPITIKASDYPIGVHNLTAVFTASSIHYSKEVSFRVVE